MTETAGISALATDTALSQTPPHSPTNTTQFSSNPGSPSFPRLGDGASCAADGKGSPLQRLRDSGIWIDDTSSPGLSRHSSISEANRRRGLSDPPAAESQKRLQLTYGLNSPQVQFPTTKSALSREVHSPSSRRSTASSDSPSLSNAGSTLRHDLERKDTFKVRSGLAPSQRLLSRLTRDGKTLLEKTSAIQPPTQGTSFLCATHSLRPFITESVLNDFAKTFSGSAVWWCPIDNMVVFDGMKQDDTTGTTLPVTRSSKGLAIANRRGNVEIVRKPLNCPKCEGKLGRPQWSFPIKVTRRGVCKDCQLVCTLEYARNPRLLGAIPPLPVFSTQNDKQLISAYPAEGAHLEKTTDCPLPGSHHDDSDSDEVRGNPALTFQGDMLPEKPQRASSPNDMQPQSVAPP